MEFNSKVKRKKTLYCGSLLNFLIYAFDFEKKKNSFLMLLPVFSIFRQSGDEKINWLGFVEGGTFEQGKNQIIISQKATQSGIWPAPPLCWNWSFFTSANMKLQSSNLKAFCTSTGGEDARSSDRKCLWPKSILSVARRSPNAGYLGWNQCIPIGQEAVIHRSRVGVCCQRKQIKGLPIQRQQRSLK